MRIIPAGSMADVEAALERRRVDPDSIDIRIAWLGGAGSVREILELGGKKFFRVWASERVPFDRQLVPIDIRKTVIVEYDWPRADGTLAQKTPPRYDSRSSQESPGAMVAPGREQENVDGRQEEAR